MINFTDTFTQLDTTLATFFSEHVIEIIDYVATPIHTLCVVLIIATGIGLLTGRIQIAAPVLVKTVALIVVVFQLATQLATYNAYVADYLTGLPDEMFTLITGYDSVDGVGNVLDDISGQMDIALDKLQEDSSGFFGSLSAMVIYFAVMIVFFIFLAVILFTMVMIKVMITLLATIGPIFILCLLFEQTRDFFQKWVTYSLQFSVAALLVGGVLAIIYETLLNAITDFAEYEGAIEQVDWITPCILLVCAAYIFKEIPNIASSLSGGISAKINTHIGGAISGTALAAGAGIAVGARGAVKSAKGVKNLIKKRRNRTE